MRRNLARFNLPMILMFFIPLLVLSGAYWFGRHPDLRILFILVIAAAAVLFLDNPGLGIGVLILSALLVPFEIGTGTQTGINMAVILVALLAILWMADRLYKKEPLVHPSMLLKPIFVFIGVCLLAYLSGNILWQPFAKLASFNAQLGGLAIYVLSMGAMLVMANQVVTQRNLKYLTWLFLGLGGVYVLGRVIPPLGVLPGQFFSGSPPGSLFFIWLVALSGGQVLFNSSMSKIGKGGLVLLIMAILWIGWNNNSRASGIYPPLGALLALIWLRSWKWGVLALISGLVLVLLIRPDLVPFLVNQDQYSIVTRQAAWQILITQVAQINPVLGLGFANYHFYTPLFPIMGYYVEFNSHNQYVDLFAQTGIVGLLAFGWLCLAITRLGFNLRKKVEDGFARGYVNACIAGLAGMLAAGMLADWLLPFVYNIGMAGFRTTVLGWLFLGGLGAIENMIREQTTP